MKNIGKNMDLSLLIIRLSVGGMMLLHGISKLTHGNGFIKQITVAKGLPEFVSYGVYVGEVIAPILMIIGIATRASSLVFAFNCAVAVYLAHMNDLFTLSPHGGWGVELLGLYFFGALALVFSGGGKYAVSKKFFWD